MVSFRTSVSWLVMCIGVVSLWGSQSYGFTFSLDTASAPLSGVAPDDLLSPGPGILMPGAGGLPPSPLPIPPVDVDGFSFSQVFPGTHVPIGAEFSVAPGSIGAAGSAVSIESGGIGFVDESADIFTSAFAGTNLQFADGDGIPAGPALPLGLLEPAASNVDGWDGTPPFGPPSFPGIYYSITSFDAVTHPVYAGTGSTGADIFFSPPVPGYSVMPALFASSAALGLVATDDIDALEVIEDGTGGPSAGDVVFFSLTPGSPTLGALGASPADILVSSIGGAPAVAFPAGAIGLLPTDDVDALSLIVIPEPGTGLLISGLIWIAMRRRHP